MQNGMTTNAMAGMQHGMMPNAMAGMQNRMVTNGGTMPPVMQTGGVGNTTTSQNQAFLLSLASPLLCASTPVVVY